jgi:hypothetical protein
MEKKIKYILSFFNITGVKFFETYANFIYDGIEDWERTFETEKGKKITPPSSVIKVIESLFDDMMRQFHSENNYDESDYWTLIMTIYPSERRINFKSECKFITTQPFKYEYDLTTSEEMSYKNNSKPTLPQKLLDDINLVIESELWDETEKVEFEFDASEGDIYISNFVVDDVQETTRLTPWSKLLDTIMIVNMDRWWHDGAGVFGDVEIIRDKSLILDLTWRASDWDYTEMNINLQG